MVAELREILKSLSGFRSTVEFIRKAEVNYREQNQSRDNSGSSCDMFEVLNSNYLSKTELIFLTFLCYYFNTTTLRKSCPFLLYELLTILPQKIESASYLKNQERINLWKLLQRKPYHLTGEWPFSYREVTGILNDSVVARKVLKRLYQKHRPRSPRRTERHRGYRDHGTLRPAHCWLPKEDYTLNENQKRIEDARKRAHKLYLLVCEDKSPVAIEDFPTIFDSKADLEKREREKGYQLFLKKLKRGRL